MKEKMILYIDMDNVLVDFESALRHFSQEFLEGYSGRFDEIPGIFAKMQPLEGAIEAYKILSDLYDTYILSTAPWENPSAWSDKLNWVKAHLGESAHKRLILSHHKNLNLGDFLIDDRTKNGADRFLGEHIQFGIAQFENWTLVTEYLLDKNTSHDT